MKQRIWLFPLVIIISLLAGCGPASPPPDYPGTRNSADQVIANFKSAVEGYEVAGMLGCLSAADFTLTITEAGNSVTKLYNQLQTELLADEENQLAWRQPITEPDGHGYKLILIIGSINYSNTSASGTYVTHTFEVRESAYEIPEMTTDQGTITWKIVEIGGDWKATEMIIEYQDLSGSQFPAMSKTYNVRGFGFSRLIAP